MSKKWWLPTICFYLALFWAFPVWGANQLAPGVSQWSFEKTNWEGKPYKGYVLEIDPKQRFTEIRPILGNDAVGSKEVLSSMAQRTGAIAAVNGGYFDISSGMPVGNVVIDGKFDYTSDILRTSFGFTQGGDVKIGYLAPKLKLTIAGYGSLTVRGINLAPVDSGLVLYSSSWTKEIPSGMKFLLYPAEDSTFRIELGFSSAIPKGGYLLAGYGAAASELVIIGPGAKAKVSVETPADWQNLRHGLTGSPLLVQGGLPVEQAVNEGLWGKVLKPAPRTAMGVTAKGKVLLVVVDGRQDNSAGLTLEELSYLMIELGAVQAVALDGGGSSEMWVKGEIVNSLSEGKERPLGNGLVIIQQMPVYIDYQRIYFDVPPLVENGRTLVPMRKIFEQLGAEIHWEQETKTVTATKGELVIELTIGSSSAIVNGEKLKLDVPTKVVDGRTLVPLRFVGEALGAKVNYVSTGGPSIYIESGGGTEYGK